MLGIRRFGNISLISNLFCKSFVFFVEIIIFVRQSVKIIKSVMKLRTIVKIAITSSVVLLCAGFALYSFFRLSAAESNKDFNLFSLVPPSASVVLMTDDAAELVEEVDGLACSKNGQYLRVSKLFSYLKKYLYELAEDTPHGLSRQMNQVIISFHEPDNDRNQVLYCTLGKGDSELIGTFIQKYVSSSYSPKTFRYQGEDIVIYPMLDGDFLACYLKSDFLAISYQKKLVEEVIDAYKAGRSLAADPEFRKVCTPKKSTSTATLYARLNGVIGWTEFDMKLREEFIYLSGTTPQPDSCFTFIHMLNRQEPVKGFPGKKIPSTAFYFVKQGVSDWTSLSAQNGKMKELLADLREDSRIRHGQLLSHLTAEDGQELFTCLFQRTDTLKGCAMVSSLSMPDAADADSFLRSFMEKPSRIRYFYHQGRYYPVYRLSCTEFLGQLTHFADRVSEVYATFHAGCLLLAPDEESLSEYVRMLEQGEVLDESSAYRAGMDGLSDSYQLIVMADLTEIFRRFDKGIHLVPDFFFRNADFFRNFLLFGQISCSDGMVYPNIVLKYQAE